MISCSHIKKSYGDHVVLDDVTLTISRGSRVSLIGPGGCGKTTLLKLLLGLIAPTSGSATLMDTDMSLSSVDQKQKILRRVGMAFQQGGLFDFMTVRENLIFAMENMTDMSLDAMDHQVKTMLASVKLSKTEHMYPFELSGGMKRRVGIVRALATSPDIALFDEPTSGLDPVTSTIILNMILDMGTTGSKDLTQIIATSNIELAIRFSDRIIVLNEEGHLVADGLWKELILDGPEWVQKFLSLRLIGLDLSYAKELHLPQKFIEKHW